MTAVTEPLSRLRALGFSAANAKLLADHFAEADRRGKPTHGAVRIDWLETMDEVRVDARPQRVEATEGFERWESNGALGYITLAQVCRAQAESPPEHARMIVAADAAPVGFLGYWVRQLADAGLASIMVATSPRRLAGPDGGPAIAGTNPIAIGVPSSDGNHLVADVSMANATHGHVLLGLADEDEIRPFGGDQSHKAFALAVALQTLVDALVGHEGYGVALVVAQPSGDPVPALRDLAAGIRLPGDS